MKLIYDPHTDPQFVNVQYDRDEWMERHCADGKVRRFRFLHGFFEGTAVRFSLSFPEADQYEGRFFLHCSPFPGPQEELATLSAQGEGDSIGFALSHGACFVSCNMGSTAVFSSASDPTIFYRSNAAAAMACRQKAQELFGEHRVYGYVFGGSGGGYKTMSCIENTNQFDGAVPFVIGSPMSLPSCLTIGALAARRLRHCWPTIVDNVEPGGSGDPYKGLTEEEQQALKEVLLMGVPPRMLIGLSNPSEDGSLPVLTPGVKMMDPVYFQDFWTKPGYEGYEQKDGLPEDVTHMTAKVISVGISMGTHSLPTGAIDDRNGTDTAWQKMLIDGSDSYLELTSVPSGDYLTGIDMIFQTGAAKGKCLRLGRVEENRVIPGMSYGADEAKDVLRLLRSGDEVLLTNRDYIAISFYHRHQVPEDTSFHAWDQYRNQGLAQRPVIAYQFTAGGCGSVQDGHIQGKVIVMNSLMDGDFPWQADWYAKKVREVNGEKTDDLFRIWYNDNCPHGDASETGDCLRFTSYLGMLHQALLDVSNWVEKGVKPAPSTCYDVKDQQITLASGAENRGGTQPIVTLTANGVTCVRIHPGESVAFHAEVETTPFSGTLEALRWSFENEQTLQEGTADMVHCYNKPGVYYPTVEVTTNRHPSDVYTRLRNLGRIRVVVEETSLNL